MAAGCEDALPLTAITAATTPRKQTVRVKMSTARFILRLLLCGQMLNGDACLDTHEALFSAPVS
jgi:hypothetical protein